MPLDVVILAAGKGTRMRSALPKVLHPVAGKPMVKHVIDTAHQLGAEMIHLVYGHGAEQIKNALKAETINWVEQAEQLGTGHAVKQTELNINDEHDLLVLYGDVPLICAETLQKLIEVKPDGGIGLLTVNLPDPTGYGRILRSAGEVVGIVEQKDASHEQLAVDEVNTGMLVAKGSDMKRWLGQLTNDNAQGEYYLTDIIALCHQEGGKIATVQPDDLLEVEGVNNRMQLARLERAYQLKQADKLMESGVTLLDPARFDLRGKLQCGEDVTIDINVVVEGDVTIGNRVKIGPNVILKDCVIEDDGEVKANSVVESAHLKAGSSAGPFARLRPGAVLEEDAHIGNFVEMKKATLGRGSKAGHLTYLGDATIGADVNIGAGTITCNYDGANKFQTIIKDGAFIGSDTQLVAPVTVGSYATIGAGATITSNVGDNELAITRVKQRHIPNWKRPEKKS